MGQALHLMFKGGFMVRRTDDKLEKDLWDLGDLKSGRYVEIEQARERPMESISGGLRDYTPKYFPKPRMNELQRVIQRLSLDYQKLITLRYIGISINNTITPLEINAISIKMGWSRRKTFTQFKKMKEAIRNEMPTYQKKPKPLTIAPNMLECSHIQIF